MIGSATIEHVLRPDKHHDGALFTLSELSHQLVYRRLRLDLQTKHLAASLLLPFLPFISSSKAVTSRAVKQ